MISTIGVILILLKEIKTLDVYDHIFTFTFDLLDQSYPVRFCNTVTEEVVLLIHEKASAGIGFFRFCSVY